MTQIYKYKMLYASNQYLKSLFKIVNILCSNSF